MDKNAYKRIMEQVVPSEDLIQRTKSKMASRILDRDYNKSIKEEPMMIKRSFSTALVVALAVMLFTATAFAAWYVLKPGEVAEKLENSALNAAFESESAININKSVTSGDYVFTLLAMVSGKDITDYAVYSNGDVLSDRTYAVLAIQKADGNPMPSTQSDAYGTLPFYVSPYIRGQKPWEVNAHSLNGGYSETVVDGVMYRMLDCDELTMFADRGVYLGVNTGSMSNHAEAFIFNEQSGELKANPDYRSSAVFELPLDKSLADPEKADAYLDALLGGGDVLPAEPIAGGDLSDSGAETVSAPAFHAMNDY